MPVVPPGSVPGTVPEMQDRARTWLPPQTSHWRDWPPERLMTAKQRTGTRISVVIPARNEERTVGRVVGALRQVLLIGTPLVDEIVVIDSDSTDGTGRAAERAGATVHRARDIAPELGSYPGKGEALWKSLLVTRGDVLVFVDADLTQWGPHFVTGLVGPLLLGGAPGSGPPDPGGQVQLVKGFYERVRTERDGSTSTEGGRVTELVARPLLSLWWPQLAGVVQPLAGEWAARRSLMESLTIPVGYGVELSTLLDTFNRHGLGAVAQVDLGSRAHRHQADHDLALMAAELMVVAEARRDHPEPPGQELHQFVRDHGEVRPRSRAIPSHERPPVVTVRQRDSGPGAGGVR
jgi:glucosyl-3-phosphoglycerate synthase